MDIKLQIKVLNKKFYTEESNGMLLNHLPAQATPGSAGLDLICTEDVIIHPGETVMLSTGIAVWIGSDPSFFQSAVGFVVPKSGRGTKEGLILANTIGVIDSDYQGELKIAAWNRNFPIDVHKATGGAGELLLSRARKDIHIKAGTAVAQLLLMPCMPTFEWDIVEEFSKVTDRGDGGFGSTKGY